MQRAQHWLREPPLTFDVRTGCLEQLRHGAGVKQRVRSDASIHPGSLRQSEAGRNGRSPALHVPDTGVKACNHWDNNNRTGERDAEPSVGCAIFLTPFIAGRRTIGRRDFRRAIVTGAGTEQAAAEAHRTGDCRAFTGTDRVQSADATY